MMRGNVRGGRWLGGLIVRVFFMLWGRGLCMGRDRRLVRGVERLVRDLGRRMDSLGRGERRVRGRWARMGRGDIGRIAPGRGWRMDSRREEHNLLARWGRMDSLSNAIRARGGWGCMVNNLPLGRR